MVDELPRLDDPASQGPPGPGRRTNFQQYLLDRSGRPSMAPEPGCLVPANFLLATAITAERTEPAKEADDKPKEKKKPKDGETIDFSKLLTDYQTPFIDAYDKSKTLKDGDKGKSATLEAVIDRMKACPWFSQLKVKFDSKAKNPDYDPATSTITINPNEPIEKQIETFVHEGFHASNARLYKLYLDGKLPKGGLGQKEYAELMGDAEVGAFEAEVKVHKELGHAGAVSYKYVDKDDKKGDMDLAKLYADKGRVGLKAFILDEARTTMTINGKEGLYTYRQYYEAAHTSYADNFDTNRKAIKGLGDSDPKWFEKSLKDNDY